jgi:hypothetical protein
MPTVRRTEIWLALSLVVTAAANGQRPGPPGAAFTAGKVAGAIASVVIHPLVAADFSCTEHGLLASDPVVLGDAIGADCTVVRYDQQQTGRRPPQHFEGDGARNEDWFGWKQTLLAPLDAMIEEVHINAVTNTPGTPGRGPATFIVFLSEDGTKIVYGHVQDVTVKQGDRVRAGQPVASVGNNGFSYMPHTHLGAWKNGVPLQIRFDLAAMGKQQEARARSLGGGHQ